MLLTGVLVSVPTGRKCLVFQRQQFQQTVSATLHGLNNKNNNFDILALNLESSFKCSSYMAFIVDILRTNLIA